MILLGVYFSSEFQYILEGMRLPIHLTKKQKSRIRHVAAFHPKCKGSKAKYWKIPFTQSRSQTNCNSLEWRVLHHCCFELLDSPVLFTLIILQHDLLGKHSDSCWLFGLCVGISYWLLLAFIVLLRSTPKRFGFFETRWVETRRQERRILQKLCY